MHHNSPSFFQTRTVRLLFLLLLATFALGGGLAVWADDPTTDPANPAATGPLWTVEGVQPLADRYIVVFNDAALAAPSAQAEGVTVSTLSQQMVTEAGGELYYIYEQALHGFAARLSPEAAAQIAANPYVAYVEPDAVMTAIGSQSPATWGLDRIDQRTLPLNNRYDYSTDGAGVHAYIIDTGIRATHTEFTGRVGNGYTAINDGQGSNDCNGHGTHVAGTVGGTTYGVAKSVTLHPVRVLDCNGSGSTSGVIAGIDWVTANHVKPAVANMSLGGGASTSLDTALRNSISAGITYAVAAGNENALACNGSPSRVAEALTVGASTNTDARASFSNYGTCLDLFAPGQNITSSVNSSDTATAIYSGTSMASPHVAGVAALYLAVNPGASPATAASAITSNATAGRLTSIGTGSPNLLLYSGFIGAPAGTPTSTPTRPAATPTPTPTPTRPATTPTPTPTPGTCVNRIVNGGFESGAANWTQSSSRGYALICTSATCGAGLNPHGGSYATWLGGANSESAKITQSIVLPARQPAILGYWHRIESGDVCGYDYGYVRVTVGRTTKTVKTYSLCSSTVTAGWVKQTIDLSSYAGKTITLAFQANTDSSNVSNLFVDDVSLSNSSTCTADAATEVSAPEDGAYLVEPLSLPKPESLPDAIVPNQR